MSGAILGWGVDLGPSDSVAAKLFDNGKWYQEGPVEWDIYCYGPGHDRLALLLNRSVEVKEGVMADYSVNLKVTLGTNGYPVLSSQPTPGEIQDLITIIETARPDPKTVELPLDLLLLPAD